MVEYVCAFHTYFLCEKIIFKKRNFFLFNIFLLKNLFIIIYFRPSENKMITLQLFVLNEDDFR